MCWSVAASTGFYKNVQKIKLNTKMSVYVEVGKKGWKAFLKLAEDAEIQLLNWGEN